MRLLLAILAMGLTACATAPAPAPNPPAPEVIEVPVKIYVPIPAELTARCRWVRAGELPSEVFTVSDGRKTCLLRYEERIETIEQIQGKPVPEVDEPGAHNPG